jgi:uncharacterized repeat protein (TIGR01451 family)
VKALITGSIAVLILALFTSLSVFASPPGTIISNQAQLDYLNSAAVPSTKLSNVVDVVTVVTRSSSVVELTRVLSAGVGTYQETVGPSACFQNGAFATLPDPTILGGGVIDPTLVQDVRVANAFNLGETIFIRLTDTDQDIDPAVVNYAVVNIVHPLSGDSETIQLSETGPATGVFAGYISSANGPSVSDDCVLQGTTDSTLGVTYTDPADATDSAQAAAILDPVSVVFESATGSPIDGALIELVDAVTGLPATVYGNDGVSIFPSSITSGSTETDSSGATYTFGTGEYRFPVIPAGSYRFVVTPPGAYTAPSAVAIPDLQSLPGAPYALGPASFASAFTHSGPLSVDFDIPVDPREGALFMQKTTMTTIAAPGDFVRYELTIENTASSGSASNVRVVDQLPAGVRFVPDSARRDSNSIADPVIGPDVRSLEFTLGDLNAGELTAITYVVEIIGGKRNQELVNIATAYADAGLVSNESDARIRLTEDLFRSTSTVIGRVVEGYCSSASFSEDQGVAGIRIYLEDGRFAVSDESGRFHFEGLQPGTHVAQIDPDTVPNYYEIIGCDTAPQFAGRVDSQFVRTTPGSLTRADFYMRRKLPAEGVVDIEMRNLGTDSTEEVAYVVTVNGDGNIRIRNLDVMVLLPDGVSYKPGTLTAAGESIGDPRTVGPSLVVDLPEQFGDWSREIRFEAQIAPNTNGELTTKAFAQFDSPIEAGQKTPIVETRMIREKAVIENEGYVLNLKFGVLSAELSPGDQLQLDALIADWKGVSDINIAAIGHSDSQNISPANRAIFADNYVLSRARALSAANYLARALVVGNDRITVQGRGPDDPVDSNATAAGRQANRRVELILSGKRPTKPSFLEVTQATSGVVIAQTQGAIPGAEEEMLRNKPAISFDDISGLPSSQVEPAMSDLEAGIEMLLPGRDFNPAIPSTKISIKHSPRQTLEVTLNGRPVNPLNYDGIEVSPDQSFAVSRWKGVDLKDGANEIGIEIVNPDGSVAKKLKRIVNYSGTAVRGEIVSEMSVLVADGKTRPVIAVRLYDRSGKPARQGAVGSFRVNAPYRSWWEVEDERKNDIVAVGSREPIYRVGAGGIALIELEPTTQAGEAELTLNFDNRRQQELRTWLSAQPRDWILVGFAEGTVGYNTLTDNMTAAVEAGFEDEYFDEGRVAFFAKGQVKGEYLLTVAYDSDRERSENRDRFQTVVDPNAYYSLYADKSEQRFDAPSQRKLYLKLERRQFFALFGDFDTGMSVTELARYERRFNGLKSGFQGENVGYTAFATETNQSFVRDDIRGDGTSGLYQLSRTPIIANSEQVRIEVRDRFDTGEILTSTILSRFLDYNLDTLDGTLYFKQPVPSRDQAFNPIFIVVEYESESSTNEEVIAGGRASVRTSNDQFEVGVSHINEGQQGAESDLTGVDVRWQLNPETLLKAEFASSNRTENNVDTSGSAHSVALEHQGEKVDLRAYLKEVDEGFGLGQQNTAEKGIRKIGVDGRSQISERFYFDGEASWQQNLETEAIRHAAKAQLRYENDGFTASTGLIHASDKFADGQTLDSNLAEVGVSKKFGDVTLRANSSFELSSDAESVDYPATTVLGADYRIVQGVDLFAEYEQASGPLLDSSMSRLGVKASPWSRAQINSSITSERTEYGPRLFSNVGLIQGFQLSERWILDVGLDQANTITDSSIRPFDPDRELVSGSLSDDFTAVFVGAVYTADLWSANSRVEYRNSDSEERKSLLSGWYREPSLGHGMSAGLTMFTSENISGTNMSAADLKFGWAWRKAESRWSFLNRIDLVFEDTELLLQKEESQRLINNFNANRRISARTQLSLQYAFKYVKSMFDAQEFSGYTDLVGIDFRRGFKTKWDWGTHASAYHSYAAETIDYGFGLDVGFNVRDNLWVTIGYNIAGFHDSDFASARYTAEGPYLQISMKADQHTLRNIANRR